MLNTAHYQDCFKFLSSLPDKSIDCIITDPPYGIGVADWDKPINIEHFISECDRVTKKFFCFFGQMPTMVNWLNHSNQSSLQFKEHIIWVKRNVTPGRLSRLHESIFIYGRLPKFYCTRGNYEDVKIPGILFDIVTIQAIQRNFSRLLSGVRNGENLTSFKDKKRLNACSVTQKEFMDKTKRLHGKDRDLTTANFTNVWSFLPPIYQPGRAQKNIMFHPCEKPIILLERLIEMTSEPNDLILDPFAGSGSLGLACQNTKRNFILIENNLKYYDMIQERINQKNGL
jgi:DNA modification methylase